MKLAAKFYGPFQVLKRIGEATYRLELPTGSRVHPVFHVSLLKQQVSSKTTAGTAIPEYESEHQALQPQAALDYRGNANNMEVLIHWQGFSPTDATWESISILHERFPEFVLEDKDPRNGGGM
jgi:hypothetical protein